MFGFELGCSAEMGTLVGQHMLEPGTPRRRNGYALRLTDHLVHTSGGTHHAPFSWDKSPRDCAGCGQARALALIWVRCPTLIWVRFALKRVRFALIWVRLTLIEVRNLFQVIDLKGIFERNSFLCFYSSLVMVLYWHWPVDKQAKMANRHLRNTSVPISA